MIERVRLWLGGLPLPVYGMVVLLPMVGVSAAISILMVVFGG